MGFWIPIAIAAASALAQNQQNKKKGSVLSVPPRLDITDAEKRVFQEGTSSNTPYEPFLPYIFGSGGVGRQYGVPQYTQQYTDSLRGMASGGHGPGVSETLGGRGGDFMLDPGAPYGGDQGLIPQHAMGGQYYNNPYAGPPTQAPWPLEGPHYGGSGPYGTIKPGEGYDEFLEENPAWETQGMLGKPPNLYAPTPPGQGGVGGQQQQQIPSSANPQINPQGQLQISLPTLQGAVNSGGAVQQVLPQSAQPGAVTPYGMPQVAGGGSAPVAYGGGPQMQMPMFLPQPQEEEEEVDNKRLVRHSPHGTEDTVGMQYWDDRRKKWRELHPERARQWQDQGRIDFVKR